MKLFISYARVDKPLCIQIVERLSNVHEVWYDRRLHAGQAWWDEIVHHLNWCEGFVYLLSPESYESEYCQREFEIAQKSGKHLFPAVIRTAKGGKILIPDALNHIHYADLSQDMQALGILMDALTIAERSLYSQPLPQSIASPETVEQPGVEITPGAAIGQAADALEAGDFDKAVFILKQAQEKPSSNRNARMIKTMLAEAETELERQAYLREAEREYAPIAELVKRDRTRSMGCDEFEAFQREFPDYDPDNLAEVCQEAKPPKTYPSRMSGKPDFSSIKVSNPSEWLESPAIRKGMIDEEPELDSSQPYNAMDWLESLASRQAVKDELPIFTPPDVSHILPPPFEWCYVPQGFVTLEDASKLGGTKGGRYEVPAFYIAKYPITNKQYEVFVSNGYTDASWWDYSDQAKQWHKDNPKSEHTAYPGDYLPRTNVSWFDALAFCRWLNHRLGNSFEVTLPTEQQWQRAAQGDDGRIYPWGSTFDPQRCNTDESGMGKPTSVMQYPNGASPCGAWDMAGNVWEWCLTRWGEDKAVMVEDSRQVVLRGGSFNFVQGLAAASCRDYYDAPNFDLSDYGVRLVCAAPIEL